MLTIKNTSTLTFASKGCFYGKAITTYLYSFQQCARNGRSVCNYRTNAFCKEVALFTQRTREVV